MKNFPLRIIAIILLISLALYPLIKVVLAGDYNIKNHLLCLLALYLFAPVITMFGIAAGLSGPRNLKGWLDTIFTKSGNEKVENVLSTAYSFLQGTREGKKIVSLWLSSIVLVGAFLMIILIGVFCYDIKN